MGARRELAGWLVQRTRPLLRPLSIATLARILGDLLGVAVLLVAASALTTAMSGGPVQPGWTAVVLIALSLLKAGLRYLEQYAGHWVAFSALQRLRELLFRSVIPQAPAATTGRAFAEQTARATDDIDRIEVFFAHTIPPVIAAVTVPAVALTWFALAVDPLTAGLIAVPLLLALLLPFPLAGRSEAATDSELAARGEVATHVADDAQGIREVLAFEARDVRTAQRRRREGAVSAARSRIAGARALREVVEQMLWGIALVLVVALAPNVRTAVLGVALLVGLWLGGAGTDDFASGLDAALAACRRVRDVVDAEPAVTDAGTRSLTWTGGAGVVFEDVSFSYPGADARAVEGVSFAVAPGGRQHLVGVSGGGKSSIAGLLLRAHDADAGRILIDGIPIADIPLAELRRAVAVVDQRPWFSSGTLADNLRLARPEASDAELEAVLRIVALDPEALPAGLRSGAGERGSALSGGQRQRLAVARALVAKPRLLVLDESLSQLDEATARTVRERIGRMPDRPTVIEITHRTDLLADDARVAVVDRGRVVESGTASALRGEGGAFSRLSARS